jgi:hypothetical protein
MVALLTSLLLAFFLRKDFQTLAKAQCAISKTTTTITSLKNIFQLLDAFFLKTTAKFNKAYFFG